MDDSERDVQRDYQRMLQDLAEGPLRAEYVQRLKNAAGVDEAQFAVDFERAKEKRDEARRLKWRERAGVDRR